MDNSNTTLPNANATISTRTHFELRTLKSDIGLTIGYLTLVLIIVLVILANVFHKRLRAAWSCYGSNARSRISRSEDMGEDSADGVRNMEEGLPGSAKSTSWKKQKGRVDELEMCVWNSTSEAVV
ncbi:hypothetical protein ONS95_013844 [Cadophora gregata]|uniref:uncharacterized protein n=1 Tax=Cadophora gregata TaxID=51156 RepID=UPI0026DA82EB|nr:uncharacterized protein ONS95_013844 [Cadophora gregata]KAK0113598.1 hypothetical protein ONS96_014453 [Cadophora gregata f. sp. sojae]KAK0114352.1 hypothetical protein ONS95_013844 [Cadophora gregata]